MTGDSFPGHRRTYLFLLCIESLPLLCDQLRAVRNCNVVEIAGVLTAGAEGKIPGEASLGQALVFNVAGYCFRELEILVFPESSARAVGELDFFNAVGLDPAFEFGS